ncbi:MAG: hypothetical protein AB7F28_05260 [Candidatus Margulisiibacteriota bacterium]
MISPLHQSLAGGRWQEMTLAEQLANVGSEFSRAFRAKKANNELRFANALDRFLELLNLTLMDPRWQDHRKREVSRLKEVVLGGLFGSALELNALESLESYFTHFGIAARKK